MITGKLRSTNVVTGLNWNPSGNGDAVTWAEVQLRIEASTSPFPIFLTDTVIQPLITASRTEMHGCWFEVPDGVNTRVLGPLLQDGAVLRNMGLVTRCILTNNSHSPSLEYDATSDRPYSFGCIDGAIANYGSGPMHLVPDGTIGLFFCHSNVISTAGYFTNSGSPQPLVRAGVGSYAGLVLEGVCAIADGWLTSVDNTSVYILAHDGDPPNPLPVVAGFTGSGPLNSPSGMRGGSGPTSFRPSGALFSIASGCLYWDTDIVNFVRWNGSAFGPLV